MKKIALVILSLLLLLSSCNIEDARSNKQIEYNFKKNDISVLVVENLSNAPEDSLAMVINDRDFKKELNYQPIEIFDYDNRENQMLIVPTRNNILVNVYEVDEDASGEYDISKELYTSKKLAKGEGVLLYTTRVGEGEPARILIQLSTSDGNEVINVLVSKNKETGYEEVQYF